MSTHTLIHTGGKGGPDLDRGGGHSRDEGAIAKLPRSLSVKDCFKQLENGTNDVFKHRLAGTVNMPQLQNTLAMGTNTISGKGVGSVISQVILKSDELGSHILQGGMAFRPINGDGRQTFGMRMGVEQLPQIPIGPEPPRFTLKGKAPSQDGFGALDKCSIVRDNVHRARATKRPSGQQQVQCEWM